MSELRFGYHGSRGLPEALIASAGLGEEVELVEYDVRDPFAPLRSGRVDVMVTKAAQREPGLVYTGPVALDPRAVVVGAGHRLAGRAEVSVEEVADHPCFDRPGDMPEAAWDEIVPPRTPGGKPLRRAFPLTTVPELMRLVASGAAVHLTVLSIRDVAPPGVRVVPVPDLPPVTVQLAHLPGAPDRVLAFAAACAGALAVTR
ncbi:MULTISPECIES: LysR substrate-binding domain-containing protein [Actinosynnema]|uniref:LysR substrate-binding domain-containing protein n=1 Tax=Actinosynnema TaxID=40566 RepID=UPI0020A48F68|nr:LysR substrate-binding domain-containing protein [Actinosynnema pretiosum]MCP2094779.1 LysR substrate binding domain-containing protein [Actinosynnema pretiosum]